MAEPAVRGPALQVETGPMSLSGPLTGTGRSFSTASVPHTTASW